VPNTNLLERDVVSALGSWLGLKAMGGVGADGNGNGNGNGAANGNSNGGADGGRPLDDFEGGWGYMVPGSSLGNLQGG
jgi:hypothetical protein